MARRVQWQALLVSSSVLIGASCASSEDDSGRPAISDGGRALTGGSAGAAGNGGSGGTAKGGSGAVGGPDGSAGTSGSAGSGGTAGSGGSQGASGTSGTSGTSGGSSGAGGTNGSTGSGGTGGLAGSAGTTGSGGTGGVGGSPDSGPTCTGFVFCDDFEDGDAVGWTKSGGSSTWSVLDDGGTRVYQGSGAEESWAGPTLNDQTVEARVKVMSFGGQSDAYRAGIMARHSGTSDFYTLQVRWDGELSIRKSTSVISGCNAVPSGIDPLQWFTLRLKASGAAASVSLEGSVNGQVKLSCTHTSGLSGGQVGFVTYNAVARFDDIRVTSP